jgi:hypothetical protein
LSDTQTITQPGETVYWFPIPNGDFFEWLMDQPPAVVKVCLVILRSINDDERPGELSDRELARRAKIGGIRHVVEAIKTVLSTGYIVADTAPGRITTYRQNFELKGLNRFPRGKQSARANCSPRGEQSEPNCTPTGKQFEGAAVSPQGKQHCTPTGEQHIRNSESSEYSTTTTKGSPIDSQPGFNPDDVVEIDRRKTQVAEHRYGRYVKGFPDDRLMLQLFGIVPPGARFDSWIGSATNPGNIRQWAWYLSDAKKLVLDMEPERVAAEALWIQRQAEEAQREAQRPAWTPPPAPQQPAPPPTPPKPKCERCAGFGYTTAPHPGFPGLEDYAWCSCDAAEAVKALEPRLVDDANLLTAKLAGKAQPTEAA